MSAMRLTPWCLLSPLCASRAVVTTATMVIVQMQTADRARSELAVVQDVGWDKGGTVRADDDKFFYAKRKRKSSIANRIFCTPHSTVSSLLAIGFMCGLWEVAGVMYRFECACTKWGEKWWFKDSFHKELQQASDHFPKYRMKNLLGDFSAEVGRENVRLRSKLCRRALHIECKVHCVVLLVYSAAVLLTLHG